MASVIANMALPGLTSVTLAGPVASAPEGFAALLAPAPMAVTPAVPLSLPKGIDITIAATLIPANFGAAGQDVPPAEPVTPLATTPAMLENSKPAAPVGGPVISQPPFSASDAIAETSPAPSAPSIQADAVVPAKTAGEPFAPAPTPDSPLDRNLASPALVMTTMPRATANLAAEPLAADPAPKAAEQPPTVSEPTEGPAPRTDASTPVATRPIAAKTPRLERTLSPVPALPDNSALSPEAPRSTPTTAQPVSADSGPEAPSEQQAEEASVPVTPILVDALLPAVLTAPTEPAPMPAETKALPASGRATQSLSIPAVQAHATAIADASIPSDTSTPPPNDNGTAIREPATPTTSTAADPAPAVAATPSPAPSFGELVAAKPIAAPAPPPPVRTEHPTPVSAHPDRIAPETAVAISRHLATGGAETITIRLDPVDMGRIEVRLSFDDGGALRGVIAADNPAALDLLRRDQAGLVASLSDAGVATDAQSFRFDTRSDDRGGQRQWTQRQPDAPDYRADAPTDEPQPEDYRPLSARGRVDVMA